MPQTYLKIYPRAEFPKQSRIHALAYNLGNFLWTLGMLEPIKDWSLTSLKEKLIKIGAKVVSHGRYVAFQMAEVAIPRQMFQEILRPIAEPRPQSPPAMVRRSMVMRSTATNRRSASQCQKMATSSPQPTFGLPRDAISRPHLVAIC